MHGGGGTRFAKSAYQIAADDSLQRRVQRSRQVHFNLKKNLKIKRSQVKRSEIKSRI